MSPLLMAGIVLLLIFLTELLKKWDFMEYSVWCPLTPMIIAFAGFMAYELLLVKSDVTFVAIVNNLLLAILLGGAAAGVYKAVQAIREHYALEDE